MSGRVRGMLKVACGRLRRVLIDEVAVRRGEDLEERKWYL